MLEPPVAAGRREGPCRESLLPQAGPDGNGPPGRSAPHLGAGCLIVCISVPLSPLGSPSPENLSPQRGTCPAKGAGASLQGAHPRRAGEQRRPPGPGLGELAPWPLALPLRKWLCLCLSPVHRLGPLPSKSRGLEKRSPVQEAAGLGMLSPRGHLWPEPREHFHGFSEHSQP